jgi:inosose dehydratase
VTSLLDRVAGAPITWGVCEVPGWGHQLGAERVLDEMERIGLRATELGPEGFLPSDPDRLRSLLAPRGIRLVAGFVPAVLHREGALGDELARVAASADFLTAAGADALVLAAATGETGYDGSVELDAHDWRLLVDGIARAVEVCNDRGLTAAVHPHFGTVIERRHHVERLLETSSVPLCLDTGHLLVGGVDPLEVAAAAPHRVAHAHLKDVAADVSEQVRTGRIGYRDAVRRGIYRPLGAGDVDVGAILRVLEGAGYRGWYVLEQDAVLEAAPPQGSGPAAEASTSLAFLKRVAEEVEIGAVG